MPRLNTKIPPVPEAPLKRPGLRNDKYMIYYSNYLVNYVFCISPLRKLFKGPCLRSMPGGIFRVYTLGRMLQRTYSRGYTWGDMLRRHALGIYVGRML